MVRLRSPLIQSSIGLTINFGGIVAGYILSKNLGIFEIASWTIILYPGIISIRGVLIGVLSGRMSTGLHLGIIESRFTNNTEEFYNLLSAGTSLTLLNIAFLTTFGALFASFLNQASISLVDMFFVVSMTIGLSFMITTPIMLTASFLSYKKGLNPDFLIYPLMSTTGDIVATLSYILSIFLYFNWTGGKLFTLIFFLLYFFTILYVFHKKRSEKDYVETIKNSVITFFLVAVIVNITGYLLGKVSLVVNKNPQIFLIYPALLSTIGDVGSIVGSNATTKLALGSMKPTTTSVFKDNIHEIIGSWIASLLVYLSFTPITHLIFGFPSINILYSFVLTLVLTNILASTIITVISSGVAITTYRRGLNPDNFVIPIESSLADGFTTLCLLLATTIL